MCKKASVKRDLFRSMQAITGPYCMSRHAAYTKTVPDIVVLRAIEQH